jgi:hypothetical protein
MNRLISKELIPHTLWNKGLSVLYLPPELVLGWKSLLEKNNLLEKALTSAPEGFEGGMSKEDTDNHFAWRFTGSVARVMLSILDPKEELQEISDAFTKFFSGNRVFLADLPCGSGAASLSILSVYSELRKQGVIPREPLDVVILGGEISKYAQCYANDGFVLLRKELEEQAITVKFEIMDWDVCDRYSNASLIQQLILSRQECSAKVLIMANFSGFLQRDKKWKDAQGQIEELFRFNLGHDSVALWIEPQRSEVVKASGFMPRLIEWFKDKFAFSVIQKNITQQETSSDVQHPLMDGSFRTHLVVVRFDLPLEKQI